MDGNQPNRETRLHRATVEVEVEDALDQLQLDEPERSEILELFRSRPLEFLDELVDQVARSALDSVENLPREQWTGAMSAQYRAIAVQTYVRYLQGLREVSSGSRKKKRPGPNGT